MKAAVGLKWRWKMREQITLCGNTYILKGKVNCSQDGCLYNLLYIEGHHADAVPFSTNKYGRWDGLPETEVRVTSFIPLEPEGARIVPQRSFCYHDSKW
jgi:hypothetical protein